MKKNTHPLYRDVLFIDSASGHRFVCGSTLKTDAKEFFEGVEYPVSYLSISSSSHPFFTGSKQLVDSERRVDRFKKRFGTRAPVAMQEGFSDREQQEQQSDSKQEQNKEAAKPQDKLAGKPAAKQAAKPAAKTDAKPAQGAKKK